MKERIIAYFDERPDQFMSGEQLSQFLQCSRTAVWKHIQELKKQGYRFESVTSKGYRLIEKPDTLSAATIIAASGQLSVFSQLKLHSTLDSTQSEAHRLAMDGANHGTLIIADSQQSGRGRHGRPWFSPAGQGIWMSLLLRPVLSLNFAPQMTLLTAVALCRTARQSLKANVGIKWPNDLLIDGKKISGILIESVGEDELVRYMVVGVGIDCNMTEDDYPQELTGKATSLLIETGNRINRSNLIVDFLREFDELYNLYMESGFAPIRTLWESHSVTLGNPIKLRIGDRLVEGIAESMDEIGALVVRWPDGSTEKIYSGETQ